MRRALYRRTQGRALNRHKETGTWKSKKGGTWEKGVDLKSNFTFFPQVLAHARPVAGTNVAVSAYWRTAWWWGSLN